MQWLWWVSPLVLLVIPYVLTVRSWTIAEQQSGIFAEEDSIVLKGRLIESTDGNTIKPIGGTTVFAIGIDQECTTDANGEFSFILPSNLRPGAQIQLTHNHPTHRIQFPLYGKQVIPKYSDKIVEIRMLPLGSPSFLSHSELVQLLEASANKELDRKRELLSQHDNELSRNPVDLLASITEYGTERGLTKEATLEKLRQWIQKNESNHSDTYAMALANWANKNFSAAGKNYRDSATELADTLHFDIAEVANRLEKAGFAFGTDDDFEEAIACFQDCLKYLDLLGDETQSLFIRKVIGISYVSWGSRLAYDKAKPKIEKAIATYAELMEIHEGHDEIEWAANQSNIGTAKSILAGKSENDETKQSLKLEAVDAFRRAIEKISPESAPEYWVVTFTNLSDSARELSFLTKGTRSTEWMSDSVKHLEETLLVRTQVDDELEWGDLHGKLGLRRIELSKKLQNRSMSINQLDKALETDFPICQSVRTKDKHPEIWFTTEYRIALAERQLAKYANNKSESEEILRECLARLDSIRKFDFQKTETSASVQFLTGLAYVDLFSATNQQDQEHLRNAVDSIEKALAITKKDGNKSEWFNYQGHLAGTYELLSKVSDGEESIQFLDKAIVAYRQSTTGPSRNLTAYRNNLGACLITRAGHSLGDERLRLLDEAFGIYQATLAEFDPRINPDGWAAMTGNCAQVLLMRANESVVNDALPLLRQSVEYFEQTLTVYKKNTHFEIWGHIKFNLGLLKVKIACCGGANQSETLLSASNELAEALSARSDRTNSNEWANTRYLLCVSKSLLAIRESDFERSIKEVKACLEDLSPAQLTSSKALNLFLLKYVSHHATADIKNAKSSIDDLVSALSKRNDKNARRIRNLDIFLRENLVGQEARVQVQVSQLLEATNAIDKGKLITDLSNLSFSD